MKRRARCTTTASAARRLLERADIGRAGLAVAQAQARALRRARRATGEPDGAVEATQAADGDLELAGFEQTDSLALETEFLDLLHGCSSRMQSPRTGRPGAEHRHRRHAHKTRHGERFAATKSRRAARP